MGDNVDFNVCNIRSIYKAKKRGVHHDSYTSSLELPLASMSMLSNLPPSSCVRQFMLDDASRVGA